MYPLNDVVKLIFRVKCIFQHWIEVPLTYVLLNSFFIIHTSTLQCMHGPNCKLGDYCTTGRRLQEVNVLGGLILPVWGTIEKALAKQVI